MGRIPNFMLFLPKFLSQKSKKQPVMVSRQAAVGCTEVLELLSQIGPVNGQSWAQKGLGICSKMTDLRSLVVISHFWAQDMFQPWAIEWRIFKANSIWMVKLRRMRKFQSEIFTSKKKKHYRCNIAASKLIPWFWIHDIPLFCCLLIK